MDKEEINKRWEEFQAKEKELTIYGLENNLIIPYYTDFITKLRNIYYGGVPASIILLCNHLTNGHCYDRAVLLAQAFIDEEEDVNLIYADVDSLRFNPRYQNKEENSFEHCFVEIITKEKEHLICDTSIGFIYDKDLYWELENPKIRKINNKQSIIKYLNEGNKEYNTSNEYDPFITDLIIPFIEEFYGHEREMYAQEDIPLLQEEVEYFKKLNKKIKEEKPKEYFKKEKR